MPRLPGQGLQGEGETMDDLHFGTRDKRGNWRPNDAPKLPWSGRVTLKAALRFFKDYLSGWNLTFFAISLAYWFLVLPSQEVMSVLSWGWTMMLLAVNMGGIFFFYGAFELRYYVQRKQARRFKYNGNFPAEQPSDVFWFKSQNLDNFLRTILVTVPIGTAVEVLVLWLFASGAVPMVSLDGNPVWFVAMILVSPLLHEAHFFFIHRAIHWAPLYRWIHSVHHNSINPSPWSSMSMHPVEGLLYFATLFYHLVLWSNPFVVVWQWNLAAYGAVVGHIGFDKLEVTEETAVNSHAYAHYLHHKYFEVNYCDDGVLPWDRWFGTWHDGTKEADERMKERFRQKKARTRQRNTEVPAE